MEIFALLTACICIGLSSGVHVQYGDSHEFRVPSRAEYLYFRPPYGQEQVLWTRSRPHETTRGTFFTNSFEIFKLTQQDNGEYLFKTREGRLSSINSITVSHHEESFKYMVGEVLRFDFNLEPKLCWLTFTNEQATMNIVVKGSIKSHYFDLRLTLQPADEFYVELVDLQVEDSGVFELKDLQDNLVKRVTLEVGASSPVWTNVGLAAGILSVVGTCCCCCLKCCCKKSSKSGDPDVDPDGVPDGTPGATASPAHLQQYSTEPGPPRYSVEPRPVPPAYAYAYQPAEPAPSAETYSPASVPFASPPSQAPAAGGGAAAPGVSPASYFLCSDTDPHFEMKGMAMATPLSSENTSANVYTSDKLKFKFL